jgi:hypothetical protein
VWVVMSVIAGAAVPHALNMLPTAAAVAVLCGLVIAIHSQDLQYCRNIVMVRRRP